MNSFKLAIFVLLSGLAVGLIGVAVDLLFQDVASAIGLMLLSGLVSINKIMNLIDSEIGIGIHLATS